MKAHDNVSKLTYQQQEKLIQLLTEQNQLLVEQNEALQIRVSHLETKVKELEARLNKNSRNSSKPPMAIKNQHRNRAVRKQIDKLAGNGDTKVTTSNK